MLPGRSVFDPTTDPTTVCGQPLQAFTRGVWEGGNVPISHPGPSFASSPAAWYGDSANRKDLTFTLPDGTMSVGFSLAQMNAAGNSLSVTGVVVSSDVYNLFSAISDTDTQAGLTLVSRNGYPRIDSPVPIQTVDLTSANGGGAFRPVDGLGLAAAPRADLCCFGRGNHSASPP